MRHHLATWLLVVGLAGLLQACGVESGADPREDTGEAQQALGSEDPYSAPGPLPGGHETGGPGDGWGSGFAGDPQYAPYVNQRDPDPYRAQSQANQRESDRIAEANRSHGRGRWSASNDRFYNDGEPMFAPPAPSWRDGPLNDKGRCVEACFDKYNDDMDYCARLPEQMRPQCRRKAMDDYALCVRDCSRKFPDPRLPNGD
jgi:hypothetical protein